MSRTYRHNTHSAPCFGALKKKETFRCRACKLMVGAPPSGGRHRNHCPYCLYSRHVDDRTPGDRNSTCGALMAPVAIMARSNGEESLVHRCLGCGVERHNRLAADDFYVLVAQLPSLIRA